MARLKDREKRLFQDRRGYARWLTPACTTSSTPCAIWARLWTRYVATEDARLTGEDRKFVKGQRYTLLAQRANLTLDGKRALRLLFKANKRIHTTYLLKESFGQLWENRREGWARRFFENWRDALEGQDLKPFEKFAAMIDRHWEGIAACCRPENKVPLGFVEGLNNTIRVIQRRTYGLRDEEYLRFKILTCMLPAI